MLVQLAADGFRNLAPLSRTFGPGSHLFLGPNGAGKTSLLEAIYLLATTRSFRTSQVSDCCSHQASAFKLGAEVDTDRRVRLDVGWQDGQRWRAVNGDRTSLAEHLAVLPVVSWSFADVEILGGPPKVRRQFLDRGIVGRRPAAIALITRYRRAAQEKRQLLLHGGQELATWNRVLAAAAADLIRLRAGYAEELSQTLSKVLAGAELGFPAIEVRYRSSPRCGREGAEAIEDELAAIGRRELAARQLLLGPHRDELVILWDGHPVRRVVSAGERKALGLALLAAQGRVLEGAGRVPIYLLDDADAELDRGRLEALWRIFAAHRQVFATSSRPQVWEGIEIDHRWRIEAGRIVQEAPSGDVV